ncbi:hypothetical protein [Paenibacillus assamensis]|uniref:hypothetical protein n=1 Tax=Paenibacillus assamensis TaxID=311244 RepID=UPI00042371A8|nr:hypothetical protein [Paenibacillus assamensis]
MNTLEAASRIKEIYTIILNASKVDSYFQYEDELDELYGYLQGDAIARGDIQLSEPIQLLYIELHQLNKQVEQLLQRKQALSKRMKEVSYDSYAQPNDAYFVDRKW